MSKIGRLPVEIKEGVTVTIQNDSVSVQGPKGAMSFTIPSSIEVKDVEGKLVVSPKEGQIDARALQRQKALYGLVRATLANMVRGVSNGFEKKLTLTGVGYRAQVSGSDLNLSVGFSHQVKIKAPEGISFKVAENVITVAGIDTSIVGDVAARIRRIRPPEPYKGKGISYQNERIRRKAGKAAKAVGTK